MTDDTAKKLARKMGSDLMGGKKAPPKQSYRSTYKYKPQSNLPTYRDARFNDPVPSFTAPPMGGALTLHVVLDPHVAVEYLLTYADSNGEVLEHKVFTNDDPLRWYELWRAWENVHVAHGLVSIERTGMTLNKLTNVRNLDPSLNQTWTHKEFDAAYYGEHGHRMEPEIPAFLKRKSEASQRWRKVNYIVSFKNAGTASLMTSERKEWTSIWGDYDTSGSLVKLQRTGMIFNTELQAYEKADDIPPHTWTREDYDNFWSGTTDVREALWLTNNPELVGYMLDDSQPNDE